MTPRILISTLLATVALPAMSFAAFDITQATGVFTPSFRGEANTNYYGWSSGTFDGTPANGLLDDPVPTLGNTALSGVGFSADPADVLSSSGNLYKNTRSLNAALTVPVAGTIGSGFTTIIIQGGSVSSPYGVGKPVFGIAGGDTPDVLVASNATSTARGQFWAKYEIVGNAGSYVIPLTGSEAGRTPSIAELIVDTYWSPTGFALDAAVVPEPASAVVLLVGSGLLRRARRAV